LTEFSAQRPGRSSEYAAIHEKDIPGMPMISFAFAQSLDTEEPFLLVKK
jgi:hypothetical protein